MASGAEPNLAARSEILEREAGERIAAVLAQTTPAQRLAWLEKAIEFAQRAGALPRRPAGDP